MLELLHADGWPDDGLVHAFTTRPGGVSDGPYASLNITRSRGDDPAHVVENRERVRRAVGLDHLVFATQVHGRAVVRVDQPPKGDQPAGEADALITDRPGIGLVCQTADCTPVLLFDPKRRAIAAIHSGWRGTVQNIIQATLEALVAHYGCDPGDMIAAIGPSISADNYRVGPEVVAEFCRRWMWRAGLSWTWPRPAAASFLPAACRSGPSGVRPCAPMPRTRCSSPPAAPIIAVKAACLAARAG
jgi:polyphenol oxidase